MPSTFKLDLAKFANKVGGKTNTVIRRVAYDTFSRVIMKTPVDTGRARANWIPQIGTPATGTNNNTDKGAYGSAPGPALNSKLKSEIQKFIPGSVLYLSNNLPYIRRLEYDGWSKQAPAGMVRVTFVEVRNILAVAVRESK